MSRPRSQARPLLASPSGPSFRNILDAWDAYIAHRSDIARGTKQNYQRASKRVALWANDTPVVELDLHEYVRYRQTSGAAQRTLALELRIIGMVVQWAHASGRLDLDHTIDIPKARVDPRRYVINHRTPSPSDVSRVLAAMPNDDWKLALSLLARTGARVGEITSLRTRDLDVERRSIALGASDGNSKTGLRWFPLDPASVHALRRRRSEQNGLLLDLCGRANQGIKNTNQGLRRRLTAACAAAGVPVFTPHGLRRMVVRRLMRAGVDPGTAAHLTGHSVAVMLKFYDEVTDEQLRAAVRKAKLNAMDP